MRIMHNTSALNAHRLYTFNNNKLSKSLEKLSSGYAINRAGDNAAGLAVSEKMRAQIAGLEQASKNAQDGISMVQTYEGALTETDSILQRMRSLAVQSANGTYDNSVDRVAIEQEFKQLNDELDQIADTDFNGVVVLNGGVMADGLKAVDGTFDYANKAGQVSAANAEALTKAQEEAQAKIDAAQKAVDAAQVKADKITTRDLSNDGKAEQWNTVDNKDYTEDIAKTLFDTCTTDGTKTLNQENIESIEVQFKWDKTLNANAGGWAVDKAWYTDKETGKDVELDTTDLTAAGAFNTLTKTANGGFTISNGTDVFANVILDSSAVNDGDTVTLTFTNSTSDTKAPSNIGMDINSYEEDTNAVEGSFATPTIALSDAAKDVKNMDADMEAALKALDAADVTFTYDGKEIEAEISDDSLTITKNGADFDITYKDADGNDVKLATITPTAGYEKSIDTVTAADTTSQSTTATAGSVEYTWNGTKFVAEDGTEYAADGVKAKNGEVAALTVATTNGGLNVGDKVKLTTNTTDKTVAVEVTRMDDLEGTVSFGVALDAFGYDASSKPSIAVSANPDIDSEKNMAIDKALKDANDALAAAKEAYPNSVEDLGEEYKVSKSNSLEQATGKLTYNDGMSLQVGARTKDLVDFTFQYDAESIGTLEADLNCTSTGLGTKGLSLATQEDANAAIDKIDHAINKVSMVRGTFGAIQNRLEHKINNLDTNNENLTAAESRIRDTDMAKEMMEFTKNQILSQASQSMLAQANQLPQGVLSLLQ